MIEVETRAFEFEKSHLQQEDEEFIAGFKAKIRNEIDFFAYLIISIENNFNFTLRKLLEWPDPFEYNNLHVDFFILILIPKLNNPTSSQTEIINKFFTVDFRSEQFGLELTGSNYKIGTFLHEAIFDFIKYFWNNSRELHQWYPLYRDHLINSTLYNEFVSLAPLITASYFNIINAFDLIVGFNDLLDPSEMATFTLLTHYNQSIVFMNPSVKDRIESSFEHFLLNCRIKSFSISVICSWNLKSPYLKKSFYCVFSDDLDYYIFVLISDFLKNFVPSLSHRHNLKDFMKDILALNPMRLEPLKNYQFAQNLIIKILVLAANDFSNYFFDGYYYISFVPAVIGCIIEEFGLSQDWPQPEDLLQVEELFNRNRKLNHYIYWILSHYPKLLNSVTPEMLSNDTLISLLQSQEFSVPSFFHMYETISHFQNRLFLNFDVKETLKLLLKDPLQNLNLIETIFETFRVEDDFELLSNLPREERVKRIIEFGYDDFGDDSYMHVTIYKKKINSIGHIEIDSSLIKVQKMIIGVISNADNE